MARSTAKLFFLSSFTSSFRLQNLTPATAARTLTCTCGITTSASKSSDGKKKKQKLLMVKEKRRTRSDKELDEDAAQLYADSSAAHVPVMLGEVLDVFSSFSSSSSKPLRSFVDCTVGAAGHSAAVSHSFLVLSGYSSI